VPRTPATPRLLHHLTSSALPPRRPAPAQAPRALAPLSPTRTTTNVVTGSGSRHVLRGAFTLPQEFRNSNFSLCESAEQRAATDGSRLGALRHRKSRVFQGFAPSTEVLAASQRTIPRLWEGHSFLFPAALADGHSPSFRSHLFAVYPSTQQWGSAVRRLHRSAALTARAWKAESSGSRRNP
jgi:hypothetical protein